MKKKNNIFMVSLLAFLFIMMLPIRTNAASTKELLENYAKSQTYLGNNGVTYHGYLKKFADEDDDGYFRYFPPTDIPQNPISYRIDDFDEDGECELLIVKFNNNQYIILDMYEVENNKAVLKDSTEVRIHEVEIGYHYLKTSLELNIGKSNCYVYSYNGRKMIGVEESGSSFIDADGIWIDCAMISYDGTGFINEADTSFIGSAYDDDFPDTFKNSFKSLGINVDAEKLLSGEKLPSDYIKDCEIFAGVIHDFPSENYDKYLELRDEVGIFNNITNISFIKKNTEGTIDNNSIIGESGPMQKYWVVFNEGTRNDRLEMSSCNSNAQEDDLKIIWNGSLELSGGTSSGNYNQYYYNENKKFEKIGEYSRFTDWATKVVASNLDVYDKDGNLIVKKSGWSFHNWDETPESFALKFSMAPSDTWCIPNNHLGFGYDKKDDYVIPEERYKEVFGEEYIATAKTDKKTYDSMIDSDWGGNCFGLSATSILFKTGYLNWNNYKNSATGSPDNINGYYCGIALSTLGKMPYLYKDNACKKLIERYQIIQGRDKDKTPTVMVDLDDSYYVEHKYKDELTYYLWNENGDYIEKCLSVIKNTRKPLILTMNDYTFNHSVAIRGDKPIEKNGDWYKVYIYDSNHPTINLDKINAKDLYSDCRSDSNETYVELNPKKNLWRYSEPGATIVHGSNNGTSPNCVYNEDDRLLFPGIIKLEDPDKIPTNMGHVEFKSEEGQKIKYTHESDFEVRTADGKLIAKHKSNGNTLIYSSDAKNEYYSGSNTYPNGYIIYKSTSPIKIQLNKGKDISILSSKKVLNIYATNNTSVIADLGKGTAEICSNNTENVSVQITNVHSSNKYTSAIIDGTIDSNDTITLKLDDNDNTSIDSSGDKSDNLVLYTNTEDDSNDQKVGELENLDGQEYDIKKKELKPKPDTRYTITYNLNGGKVSGNPTSYTKNTSSFTLNNPTKEGYTFKGWTGSNGTTPQMTVTVKTGTTGKLSYTANWEKKKDYRPAFVEDKNTYTDLPYDYYEALKTLENDWKWSPSVHTQFALAYLDNNNVPDLLYRFEEDQDIFDILLLNNTGTTGVSGYNDVITENYYYPKTGVYCGYGYDPNYEGKFSENYLKVEGNKTSYVLGRFYNDKFGYEYYYTDFEMSHKLPNKAAFDKELKKLVGNAPRTKLKVYDNTEANRKSVILAHVKKDPTPVKGKKTNPITAKGLKKTLKAKSLKKKAKTFKLITVKKAIGKVTYKVTGGNKKSKKALKINSKTGKITVKKKTKKGTYKIKVKVSAAGNKNYKSGSKTVTVTVKVK